MLLNNSSNTARQGEVPPALTDNPHFEQFLDEECKRRHPCSILVEVCRKLKLNEPSYATQEKELPTNLLEASSSTSMIPPYDDSQKFECKCVLSDLRCFSVGYGKSKKLAKFKAAKMTI